MAKKEQPIVKKEDNEVMECFVIMPISDPEGYEKDHFLRVYRDIFEPACEHAGFKAVRADDIKHTQIIHLEILKKLLACPMAICDLSSRNPNVLFELGIRQAFDKPTLIVQEFGTPAIFDTNILKHIVYSPKLNYREVLDDQMKISEGILATYNAKEAGGTTSLVDLLSIEPVQLRDAKSIGTDEMLKIILNDIAELKSSRDVRRTSYVRRQNPNDNRSLFEQFEIVEPKVKNRQLTLAESDYLDLEHAIFKNKDDVLVKQMFNDFIIQCNRTLSVLNRDEDGELITHILEIKDSGRNLFKEYLSRQKNKDKEEGK